MQSAERTVSTAMAALRQTPLPAIAENDAPIVPDVYFSWDAVDADVSLELNRADGCLFHVNARVGGHPRWLSLNVALGTGEFRHGDVIALMMELDGAAEMEAMLAVRSVRDGSVGDTVLNDPLPGADRRTVRTIVHPVSRGDALVGPPGFHTLIVMLPATDFALRLHDLRLCVLPASRNAFTGPTTLSSFAT